MRKSRYIIALVYAVCVVALVGCGMQLWYGTYGLLALHRVADEHALYTQQVAQLQQDVAMLERQITEWQNPFAIERFAREQLQMAKPDETIYFY